jgi:hypothetical protein
MTRARFPQTLPWIAVAALAIGVVVVGWPAAGPGGPSAAEPAVQAAKTPPGTSLAEKSEGTRKFRPRLPNYFNRVVDEKQRQKIYEIQREYFPKIQALEAQLAALVAERDQKVEAVLTPEQREEVEKLRAEAAARRKGRKRSREEPAEKTPAPKTPAP